MANRSDTVIDVIAGIVIFALGVSIGYFSSCIVKKYTTPDKVWDHLMWALDRAEKIPALRDVYEKFAARAKD